MSIHWFEKEDLLDFIPSQIRSVNVVLDIGPGIRPQQFIVPNVYICFEPYKEYLEMLKQRLAWTNSIIIEGNGQELIRHLPSKVVDTIFMIDVLEHIEEGEGRTLINECERVARCQVVIFTPLGFLHQDYEEGDVDGWNMHGGTWQQHKSGWLPEDFSSDWEIFACRDYHLQNGKGEKLDPPQGAFYAIKNIIDSADKNSKLPGIIEIIDHTEFHEIQVILQQITSLITEATTSRNMAESLRLCQKDAELGERAMLLDIQAEEISSQHREIEHWITDLNKRDQALNEENEKLKKWANYLSTTERELKKRSDEFNTREVDQQKRSDQITNQEAHIQQKLELIIQREAEIQQSQELVIQREAVIQEKLNKLWINRIRKIVKR